MNNNKLDEAALLAGGKGVFSKTSYITIGSKDKPEPYKTDAKDRSAFGGKHFMTNPPKEGRTIDTYFEKKHPWISDGDKYATKVFYKDSGERKKGFLTSDFAKRDEFTNTIRTEQYREQLKGEAKFTKKALELMADQMGADTMASTTAEQRGEEDFFYDRVFEKPEQLNNLQSASKTHRWTENKCNLSKDRDLGLQRTTNAIAFQAPTEFEKPEHAHRPLVRDTFYRKTNPFFPAGMSADPA